MFSEAELKGLFEHTRTAEVLHTIPEREVVDRETSRGWYVMVAYRVGKSIMKLSVFYRSDDLYEGADQLVCVNRYTSGNHSRDDFVEFLRSGYRLGLWR